MISVDIVLSASRTVDHTTFTIYPLNFYYICVRKKTFYTEILTCTIDLRIFSLVPLMKKTANKLF